MFIKGAAILNFKLGVVQVRQTLWSENSNFKGVFLMKWSALNWENLTSKV